MPRPPLVPVLRAGAVLLLGAFLLWAPRRKCVEVPPESVIAPADAPPFFTVDMQHDAGATPTDLPVPTKPFRGQRKDCRAGVHTTINGGCWRKLADTPPCEEAYLWRGGCYLPVMTAERPPTSLEE